MAKSHPVPIFFFLLILFSCGKKSGKEPVFRGSNELSGEELAREYCTSCHMFVAPNMLNKEMWKYGLLPQMGHRMGIYGNTPRHTLIEKNEGGRLVVQANIFPEQPMVTDEQWGLIHEYFYEQAPEKLEIPEKELSFGIEGAEVEIPEFHIKPPMITAIAQHGDQVYVADVKGDFCTINVLDRNLRSVSTLALPSPISHIGYKSDTLLATLMGGFMPTDEPTGSIIKMFKVAGSGNEYKAFQSVIKGLQRPVHTNYADLNGDDIDDIVVCEYGNHTGKLSLLIGNHNGTFNKQILSSDPGASYTVIKDLNQDGLPDIVALMAQGKERIDIYFNKGNGSFEAQTVLNFSPVYGSVSFDLVDWNKDGFEDIIYVNGDNADYSRTFKPYHGVRLYLNDGENNFREAFFQHQNGAYKAIPYDFDMDGDLDIAMTAFFPDLINAPEEGFIYMENVSTGDSIQFNLQTFKEAATGRWLVMEVVDLNDNDFPELLLGSFAGMAINDDVDGRVGQRLLERSPTLIKLVFNDD
ncbi:MAG: VCBS repeat-containing protein [Cyclobacteriaceae bacterium]